MNFELGILSKEMKIFSIDQKRPKFLLGISTIMMNYQTNSSKYSHIENILSNKNHRKILHFLFKNQFSATFQILNFLPLATF